ncbi:MAG: dCMP deaminase family protein [Clostridia bacterium]|nr:dCMP deaminase family protein [Clostridia bacterium]
MARLVRTRSTCPRRQVGAVLVRERRVIATGYNGSLPGLEHCEDVGCQMEDGHCVRCVHAELNALLQCAATGQASAGSTLYCTDFPCLHCAKALVQAGVLRVVYERSYPDPRSVAVLAPAGVRVARARFGPDGFELVDETGGE